MPCLPHHGEGDSREMSNGNVLRAVRRLLLCDASIAQQPTHMPYKDSRVKSKGNQSKILHLCKNSLEFSLISREVYTFPCFAALRTNGLVFLYIKNKGVIFL